jgi:hypothetical protein
MVLNESPPPPHDGPERLIRIIHCPAPHLTYTVQIRPTSPTTAQTWTEHTHAEEASLFSARKSTCSFADFGVFRTFVKYLTPEQTNAIAKVQWEAHSAWDVASASTLTIAEMLAKLLPGLRKLVVHVIMETKEADGATVRRNLKEWKKGLKELKKELKVVIRTTRPKGFKVGLEGSSLWRVDPTHGRIYGLVKVPKDDF